MTFDLAGMCWNAWRGSARRNHAALLMMIATLCTLIGCGGGTEERPETVSARPVVGAPEPAERPHCPARTIPVPPGADFSGRTLYDIDIPANQDLRGANFDGANLVISRSGTDFTGASFRGATISVSPFTPDVMTDLTNANFEGATFQIQDSYSIYLAGTLKGTCFIGAKFPTYSKASLQFAADIDGVDFSYSNALDTTIEAALASSGSKGNRFQGASGLCDHLDSRYLKAMDLTATDLSACRTAVDGKDLSNASFAGADLNGFRFSGSNIAGASFDGAVLGSSPGQEGEDINLFRDAVNPGKATYRGTRFTSDLTTFSVDLRGADFTGAHFRRLTFGQVDLRNAKFDNATASGFNVAYSPMAGTSFRGFASDNAYFISCQTDSSTDFTGALLIGANSVIDPDFDSMDLTGVKFDNATFKNFNLGLGSFRNASFRGATMDSSTRFQRYAPTSRAVLDGADFTGATAAGVDFTSTSVNGAVFDGAVLNDSRWGNAPRDKASFQRAILDRAIGFNGIAASGARFNLASAVGVDFSNALLYGADFTNADLTNSAFVGSVLTDGGPTSQQFAAKFDGAKLKNVSFANAKLTNVSFRNANLYGDYPSNVLPQVCVAASQCGTPSYKTGATCSCATMAGATLTNTDFSGAFLWGVDFSGADTTLNGTVFDNAILIGANFGDVSFRIANARAPSFSGAMLQGADLGRNGVGLVDATLTGAYLDFEGGNSVTLALPQSNTSFRGGPGAAGACVATSYSRASVVPGGVTLDCPSGDNRACGPIVKRPFPNPYWNNGRQLANAAVPGWYATAPTYEPASAPLCTALTHW